MSTTILDKIRAVTQRKEASAIEQYFALVRTIGSGGKEPDPAKAAEILSAAGKTVDECEADVQRHRRRLQLRTVVERGPHALKEQKALDPQLLEANKKLEAAQEEHTRVTEPLYQRARELQAQIDQVTAARQELLDNPLEPSLATEIELARFNAIKFGNEAARLRRRVDVLAEEIASDLRQIFGHDPHPDDPLKIDRAKIASTFNSKRISPIEWLDIAQAKQRELNLIHESLPDLDRQHDAAAGRLAELEERILRP